MKRRLFNLAPDSNKRPESLQAAIAIALVLGLLHGLAGPWIVQTGALSGMGMRAALVAIIMIGTCGITAVVYFQRAAKMEARRRWAVIATLLAR